jgi:hypothetical protein
MLHKQNSRPATLLQAAILIKNFVPITLNYIFHLRTMATTSKHQHNAPAPKYNQYV